MRRRWSVTRRLLASYLVLFIAFAVTMTLGYSDLQKATAEAELSRSGLVPLQLSIGQALAEQNVLAAQLNHATAAKNPADVREWIETARKTRPLTLAAARKAAERLDERTPEAARLRSDALADLDTLEARARTDADAYQRFFDALTTDQRSKAEQLQSDIVKLEAENTQLLRSIKSQTEVTTERLGEKARARERRAIQLLVGLSVLTLVVAAGITLYARRVLRPLGNVTDRARAVAAGDVTPRPAVDDGSEIGELAETFEGMVGAIADARKDLVKAERLAAIGKMAAHITHEIRNPLSAISLNLEMLEGELEGGEEAREKRELVAAIKAEANRLSRLSEQYLSLARRPVPTVATESVGELAEEVLAFLKPELDRARVKFDVRVDPEAPAVPIDEGLLRQAILNLVRNAREAMSEGGELSVRVARDGVDGVDLVIEDSGPGIPEELRASIFDPFFTTKQR
ncbi:MAG: HAMP domain-containing protein, partial [Polyangiaceae bacterium]|nr:HAMP domain-containing protein [Polyangiaceae bacterium]